MRKTISFLAAAAICACASALSFTDDLGRAVSVDAPKRAAVLQGSLAQVWQLGGGRISVATEDAFGELAVLSKGEAVCAGTIMRPNAEVILASRCDFAVLGADIPAHRAMRPFFESARIPCAYFSIESFSDYLRVLKIFCGINGAERNFALYGSSQTEKIESALREGRPKIPPKVLLLRARSGGVDAQGSDSMAGAMLKEFGCANVADTIPSGKNPGKARLKDVSMEFILAANPDCIFVETMGGDSQAQEALRKNLSSRPAWARLSAVKGGRLFFLPRELFHYKPNARWHEAYRHLAQIFILQEGR